MTQRPQPRRRSLRDEVRRAVRTAPNATAAQIAARLGCAESTVRKHAHELPARHAQSVAVRQPPSDSLASRLGDYEQLRPGALTQLAACRDDRIRRAVATRWDCPPELLGRLASDRSYTVRAAVARHPNSPPRAVSAMALRAGDHQLVMLQIAARAVCSRRVLSHLATHWHGEVRRLVAARRDCPAALLDQLCVDPDVNVARTAHRTRDKTQPNPGDSAVAT